MKIVSACLAGVNCRFDGAFSGKLVKGDGITAALLTKNGIKVITEEEL